MNFFIINVHFKYFNFTFGTHPTLFVQALPLCTNKGKNLKKMIKGKQRYFCWSKTPKNLNTDPKYILNISLLTYPTLIAFDRKNALNRLICSWLFGPYGC